jgi:hypothetical protein
MSIIFWNITLAACHLLAYGLVAELISSTLKMKAICSSETSVDTQQTTRRHIPEDDTLYNHRCGNIKSYMCNIWLAVGWVFFEYFGFSCQFSFHQLLCIYSSSCHRRYIISILAASLNQLKSNVTGETLKLKLM